MGSLLFFSFADTSKNAHPQNTQSSSYILRAAAYIYTYIYISFDTSFIASVDFEQSRKYSGRGENCSVFMEELRTMRLQTISLFALQILKILYSYLLFSFCSLHCLPYVFSARKIFRYSSIHEGFQKHKS